MPESLVISGAGLSFSGGLLVNPFYGTVPRGNITYTNTSNTAAATYTFVVPANVYSISYVVVGAGGQGGHSRSSYDSQFDTPGAAQGGSGGALAYRNNVSVTPGQSVTVTIGQKNGGNVLGNSTVTVNGVVTGAGGGRNGFGSVTWYGSSTFILGGTPYGTYNGGGAGGSATSGTSTDGFNTVAGSYDVILGGGGGAGGYSGAGGDGGYILTRLRPDAFFNIYEAYLANAKPGVGGAGGGGRGAYVSSGGASNYFDWSAGGGGVSIYGRGNTGSNTFVTTSNVMINGGSGGANGNTFLSPTSQPTVTTLSSGGRFAVGGGYGGGGGAVAQYFSFSPSAGGAGGSGGLGVVRIVWGWKRAFPSTDVSNDITGDDAVLYLY
jgi:hypothetical protein